MNEALLPEREGYAPAQDMVQYLDRWWPCSHRQGYKGPGWYWWDIGGADCSGPYETEEEARVAAEEFLESL